MLNVRISEKGVLPLPLIIGAVVILVLLGGGFFFLTKSDKGAEMLAKNAPSLAGAVLNDKCPYNDSDLCKFMNNYASLSDFRVKSVMSEKGDKMETLYEMQGQGKSHMMMSIGGKESHNTITIDNTVYTKDLTDNKWTKEVLEKVKDDTSKEYKMDFPDASDSPEMVDKTKYNKLAKEACGNLQCFKYEVVEQDDKDSKQIIWFDDKEYKLRKMRVETKDSVMEMEYSYDNLSIQVPSPIKEGKGSSMMPGGGAMPAMSAEDKKAYEDAMKQSQQMQKDTPINDSSMMENNESSNSEDY